MLRLTSMIAIVVLAITCAVFGATQSATADEDYPSWDEVAALRSDLASSRAEVSRINGLIAQLQQRVDETAAAAAKAGDEWQTAENAYVAAYEKTKALQAQADASNALAEASEQRAGQVAAQLMRGGAEDLTVTLLVTGDQDNLLNRISTSKKVTEQAQAVFSKAQQDRNTAQALSDQAAVAEAALKVLKEKSEAAYKVAQEASAAAATALQDQQTRLQTLQQQVAYLEGQVPLAEAQYRAGIIAKFNADPNLEAGFISEQGWVKPSGGYITSSFGYRTSPAGFHKGTDLGAGCGANIYSATYGTVTMAISGYNGGYGNMIEVSHADGTSTRYGHIQDGGILVSYGDEVGIGEHIGRVGNTGFSFGCHLHFETFDGSQFVNPVGFMADRGIQLG